MKAPLSAVVKRLANTPPEVVCEILNDLRIWDVLCLICHNEPNINNAILIHSWYGKIFSQDFGLLLSMREVVQTYWDFSKEMRYKLVPLDSVLAMPTGVRDEKLMDPYSKYEPKLYWAFSAKMARPLQMWYQPSPMPKHGMSLQYLIIRKCMEFRMALHLHGLSGVRYELLPLYSEKPHCVLPNWADYTLDGMKERWYSLRTAQNILMGHRIRQLERATELLESNPDILKLASDPGQHRRKNIAHIIGRMKKTIQHMSKISMIRGDQNIGRGYFLVYFPIVPFDECLRNLLKVLNARRFDSFRVADTESDMRHNMGEDGFINTFWAGLSFIYTRQDKWKWTEDTEGFDFTHPERIPRILYNDKPYDLKDSLCVSNLEFDNLKFVSGHTKFHRFLPHAKRKSYTTNQEAAWDKHDDRELEWLEAFVKVYRFVFEGTHV